MYYIYILHAALADKYYVGYTDNYVRRLQEHNFSEKNTYTSKYRPWVMIALFACGTDAGEAMKMEKFIKQQKSRRFIKTLCDPDFCPHGVIVKLTRITLQVD